MTEFDIYNEFIGDEFFKTLPFLFVDELDTDIYVQWSVGDRLDRIAYKYYNNPSLYKLILLANPSFISEDQINVDDYIRIPFPKESLFNRINLAIANSKKF
jgi:phage tail protein X